MSSVEPMSQEQLDEFARDYLATNPAATPKDVFAAIRASGYQGLLQSFQVHRACEAVRPTPTLADIAEAVDLMAALSERYEWVAVFWDRGWGDSGQKAEISIIVDGDGQMPLAWLTPELYADLLNCRAIAPNSLHTFKARRLHDFLGARRAGETVNW